MKGTDPEFEGVGGSNPAQLVPEQPRLNLYGVTGYEPGRLKVTRSHVRSHGYQVT